MPRTHSYRRDSTASPPKKRQFVSPLLETQPVCRSAKLSEGPRSCPLVLQYHRPALQPSSSPPPCGAYRGPAQAGEPPQRVGLGHGCRRVQLLSSPRKSAAGRGGVGDEQPQRSDGNLHCGVRTGWLNAHPGRCAPVPDPEDEDDRNAPHLTSMAA